MSIALDNPLAASNNLELATLALLQIANGVGDVALDHP